MNSLKLRIAMANKRGKNQPGPRVAVLVDTSTSWGRRIIEGVHRYQSLRQGWQLFVEPRGVEQRRWLPPGWKGDGVIARIGFPALSGQLKELGLPVVNVSAIRIPDTRFPRITTNLVEAANMAADHFLDAGFRHFAYFSLLGLEYVAEHREAFCRRVESAGWKSHVFEAMPQLGAAEPEWMTDLDRLADWLAKLPKPLAVLTWNTSGAREVLYACAQGGLRVPEEISVMSGSEDDLFCKVAPVPISAVNPAAEEIGFRAAERLEAMMNRPKTASRKDLLVSPLGVVVRRSTETLAVEDPTLVKALHFIRKDPSRDLHVDDIAAHAGICRRVLEQRFSKLLGRSPASEIRRVRIERAVHLLQTTRLPVSEVAQRSGFNTAEYMAAVFRNQFDATPLSFRRKEA